MSDQDQDSGHSACSSITAIGDGILSSNLAAAGDRASIGPGASLSSASSFAGSDVTSTTLVANNGNSGTCSYFLYEIH